LRLRARVLAAPMRVVARARLGPARVRPRRARVGLGALLLGRALFLRRARRTRLARRAFAASGISRTAAATAAARTALLAMVGLGGAHRGFRETRHLAAIDLLLDQVLDRRHEGALLAAHQRDRL